MCRGVLVRDGPSRRAEKLFLRGAGSLPTRLLFRSSATGASSAACPGQEPIAARTRWGGLFGGLARNRSLDKGLEAECFRRQAGLPVLRVFALQGD